MLSVFNLSAQLHTSRQGARKSRRLQTFFRVRGMFCDSDVVPTPASDPGRHSSEKTQGRVVALQEDL